MGPLFVAAALSMARPVPALAQGGACAPTDKAVADARAKRDVVVAEKAKATTLFHEANAAVDQALQAWTAKQAATQAAFGAYFAAGEATAACRKSLGHKKGACAAEVAAEKTSRDAWKRALKDEGTARGVLHGVQSKERATERQLESASSKVVAAQARFGTAVAAHNACLAKAH